MEATKLNIAAAVAAVAVVGLLIWAAARKRSRYTVGAPEVFPPPPTIYGVAKDGRVFAMRAGSGVWDDPTPVGGITAVAVNRADGAVYALGAKNQLLAKKGGGWEMVNYDNWVRDLSGATAKGPCTIACFQGRIYSVQQAPAESKVMWRPAPPGSDDWLPVAGVGGRISSLAFLPDGRMVGVGAQPGGTGGVYRKASPAPASSWTQWEGLGPVKSVAYSADANRLFGLAADGSVVVARLDGQAWERFADPSVLLEAIAI